MSSSKEIVSNHIDAEIIAIKTKRESPELTPSKRLVKHHVTGMTHPIRFQHISAEADTHRRAYRIFWGKTEIGIASSYAKYDHHWDATCTAMFDPYESDTIRGLRSKDFVVEWLLERSGISCVLDSRYVADRPCRHTLAVTRHFGSYETTAPLTDVETELAARLRATGLVGTVGERTHKVAMKLITDMTRKVTDEEN